MTTIFVPATADIRLHSRGSAWFVTVAASGGPQDPETLTTRTGGQSAVITHDAGLDWPDKKGQSLASAVLAQPGGAAVLIFEGLVDAMACRDRLRRERAA